MTAIIDVGVPELKKLIRNLLTVHRQGGDDTCTS